MHIDDYDENGRTPLMNAAIVGNDEEVERLLKAGANPFVVDRDFGNTTADDYAARYAKNSKEHQRIREILKAHSSCPEKPDQEIDHKFLGPDSDELIIKKETCTRADPNWPYELIRTVRGEQYKRIRTSVFYLGALISFSSGIYLIKSDIFAGFLLLFSVTLCLILYPPIRFLFGGKDSLAASIATVMAEEFIKSQIAKKSDPYRNRRKR